MIFEISVRLCAQSLFLTNASFYLSICTKILSSFFEKKSKKAKKTRFHQFQETFLKPEVNADNVIVQNSEPKANNFSNYFTLVNGSEMPAATSANLLLDMYTSLFKSINIQTSNFVNLNSKLEIENILNCLYVHLCVCVVSSDNEHTFVSVLKKFTQASFFNR